VRTRWWTVLGICALAIAVPGVVIAAGPGGEHAPGAKFKLVRDGDEGFGPAERLQRRPAARRPVDVPGLEPGPAVGSEPVGQGYGNTWAQVVAYFDTTYPNHRVLEGFLDDDSSSFFAGDAGCAYYDLVSVGARTYTNHTDADGGPGAKTNSCPGS
jgi:hypothetical protein